MQFRSNMQMHRNFAISSVILILLLTDRAQAHNLIAKCRLNEGHIEVTVMYDTGGPAWKARICVLSSDKHELYKGDTDRRGRWRFATPPPGQYFVRASHGAGHATSASFTLKENELNQLLNQPNHSGKSESSPNKLILETPEMGRGFNSSLWLKAGIGVGIIGLFCVAMLIAICVQRKQPRENSNSI